MSEPTEKQKPTLVLLAGSQIRNIDAIDDFFLRLMGRRMTAEERQYAKEKLIDADTSKPGEVP